MLPFGSLFTQLPLLVIGLLYVLYLGLSVVNKEKTNLSEENVQFIETGNNDNFVDYFTLAAMSFHSPADKSKSCFIVPSDFFVKEIIFPDKEDFPNFSFYEIYIFSRPPPQS